MDKQKELLAKLVDIACDDFSNHTCNDVDDAFFKSWSLEERQEFVKEFHKWNGDPEEYDPKCLHLPDYVIMRFLANKLLRCTTADKLQ